MRKIYVQLVHGTWAGKAKWTEENSEFRNRLDQALSKYFGEVKIECVKWNGWNRWQMRSVISAKVLKNLQWAHSELSGYEFLIVGHSHGGNIALDALRDFLESIPAAPILGVIGLNTPFLKQEVRS